MTTALNWGIIGSGRIARIFAVQLSRSQSGRLVAIGSRDAQTAGQFAARFEGCRPHGSYEALLADSNVNVVYIATPHSSHPEWIVKAAQAGKHILCEKPLALTRKDAEAAIKVVRENDVFLMEGFMYRFHPQTARIQELVASHLLGELRMIQATFSFYSAPQPKSRIYIHELGGGGILDVGCYPVSMARLLVGTEMGRAFANPIDLHGCGRIHPTLGIDGYAAAVLKFSTGTLAQVACGIAVEQDNSLRVYGSKGWLHVPCPWTPAIEGGEVRIFHHQLGAKEPQEIVIEAKSWLYSLEADEVAQNIAAGKRESAAMSLDDTLGNMEALDRWRASIGEPA